MARRRPLIRDRRTEIVVGIALLTAGSWLLHEAYEGRGVSRPWATRLLPGG